jgi:hypothetical protein
MAAATDVDLKKRLAPLLAPPREPVLVDVPELGYIAVDGRGAPTGGDGEAPSEFQLAIGALYSVLYTAKFALKRTGTPVPVLPLEALWFGAGGATFDMSTPSSGWSWRALIAVANEVTPEVVDTTVTEVRARKGTTPALDRLRHERWCEGRAAQVMHIGPYSEEASTIERLHAFIAARGLRPRGAHHELYLGDPRRAAPEKLRTIIRQPVSEG